MTLEEMEVLWMSLEVPQFLDGISGKRATGMPERPVYLAVDGRGRRHLLILVPDDILPLNHRETRGLEINTARFQVGTNPEEMYIDLVCTDQIQNPTFSAVIQDILRTLVRQHVPLRDDIANALTRWRAFWSTKTEGMSKEDALGLFGELWFMRRWLSPINARIVNCWQATEKARHDFQLPVISIEVKTSASRSTGEPIHLISGLDQLDKPEQGDLFLFSLQITEDSLAVNSLHTLVDGLVTELQNDFQALSILNDKLAGRGYSPADRTYSERKFRIIAEHLYRIEEGFPHLTRETFQPEGLPLGVFDIRYSIDLAACHNWLLATAPTDPAASFLHSRD